MHSDKNWVGMPLLKKSKNTSHAREIMPRECLPGIVDLPRKPKRLQKTSLKKLKQF